MEKKSMIDVAYEIVKEGQKVYSFKELYDEVAVTLDMADDLKMRNIGEFYTELTIDGRFVALGDNTWDLRERHTYEKSHDESINEVYNDVDDDSGADEEDKEEEKAYNAEIEGKEVIDDEQEETPETEDGSEAVKYSDEEMASLIGK